MSGRTRNTWLWLWRGLVWLSVLAALLLGLEEATVWSTLPGGDVTADIPGLSAPVSIEIDADAIPRIRAANERDAAAALGFAHARERFFQMDLTRRSAAGELAELVGASALPIDRQMRVLGVRRAAARDLAGLPTETRAMLEAYTQGVNAWLARRGRFTTFEYLLLGPPRPWQPVDCLLWAKAMGLYLSGNWRTELARAGLMDRMSPADIRALWPTVPQPLRPDAAAAPGLPALARRLSALLPSFPAPFTQPGSASNEWAVDGAHSATGAPILAGDPHLAFALPGIWYLARIDLPDRSLTGATAPGVPFLVLGQNGHIAWSFTSTGADVQDLFVETPVGQDSYATPDGPRSYTHRKETIHVRFDSDEVIDVRETRHGPVVSDLLGRGGPVIAASMANLMPGDSAADGLYRLNRARSIADAAAAAPLITSPVQNLLVADRDQIGLFVTGRVPLRKQGDGALPAPGADGAFDWTGWASGADLPHFVAPPSGRLVNANERPAPADFPVFLGADWNADWRARRIRALLDHLVRPDVSDFAAMQVDQVSTFATDILPILLKTPANGSALRARNLLREWDGDMRRDLAAPLIFVAWTQAATRRLLSASIAPQNAGAPGADRLAHALATDTCPGGCAALLSASLSEAVGEITATEGPDPAAWRWGDVHIARFPHPLLSLLPLLGDRGGAAISVGGGDDTLLRSNTGGRGFTAIQGASYRGVYDLANPDRSLFMIAPGQSGHFASLMARHFLEAWRDGKMITIPRTTTAITARLALRPAP